MMKIFTTLLAFIHFVFSFGATVQLHYCHDQISSINVFSGADHLSCCQQTITNFKNSNCCRDESVKLEIDSDFSSSILDKVLVLEGLSNFLRIEKYLAPVTQQLVAYFNRPPPCFSEELYLLFTSLLFYE